MVLISINESRADSGNCNKEKYVSIAEGISGVTREDWVKDNKLTKPYNSENILKIEQASIYFVVVNKVPLAVRALKFKDTIVLDKDKARYFAGNHYNSEEGKNPYLVRAMFENFTGADFDVRFDNNTKNLYIKYLSLGASGGKFFSPLVVNLEEQPKKVILSFGGAI